MKNRFHVFSRMFTKVNLFLFLLFSLLAVPSAWAEYYDLSSNGEAVTLPCTDPKTVSASKYKPVTSFVIYDDGGSGNNYSNNCGGYLTVNALEGYGIKVSGWVMAETYDTLRILNGSSISWFPQLIADIRGTGVNSKKEFGPFYTTDNHMVVSLRTDGSVVGPGVMMNVEFVPLRKAKGSGMVWFDNPYDWFGASEGESQTYSEGMTVPFVLNPNYKEDELWGLKVRRLDGGGLVEFKKNADGLYEFVMPASDVYVDVKTESSKNGFDLFNGERSLFLGGTKTLKVYDNGGPDYPYSNNFDGWLSLSTPSGFYFKVTGTVETEPSTTGTLDYLEIYEGEKSALGKLICKVYTKSGSSTTKVDLPSNCVSSNEYMTIHFRSDVSITASGLDLTVSSVGNVYSVKVLNTDPNGRITSDVSSAETRSTVTVTAKPNSGYVLKSVSVINKTTGYGVTTYGNATKDNKVTFTMPAADVEVTPTFVKDTYSITKISVTGGSVSGVSSAKVGTTVTMTTNATSGYLYKGATVDVNGSYLTVSGEKGFLDGKFSFNMPIGDVTVTPSFTSDWSAEGGLFINMSKAKKYTAEIPSGVKSFKVYDDGGKSGYYSGNNRDTLVLHAPSGYVLQLSGSVFTNSYGDSLLVYNGSGAYASNLLGTYKGYPQTISNVLSSGTYMTLVFHSGAYSSYNNGLDLTVKLIPTTNPITYTNKNSGGSVTSAAPATGLNGSTISYAYSYNSGYIVSDITAVDANGKRVPVSGGWYNGKKASFTMPLAAVTVTSSYTNDWSAEGGLYINMRKSSKFTATIPSGVKSFKVYDDGGASGSHSGNNRDTLVLNAPSGYVLQLSGSITAYSYYDSLLVYNGTGAYASSLLGKYKGTDYGTVKSIGTALSSSNAMTLVFHTGSYTRDGLDLTVKLIPIDYAIQVNGATNGKVIASQTTKLHVKDTVSLVAVANSGYMLKDIVAKDLSGNTVKVSQYSFSVSELVMPAKDLVITPTFTNTFTAAGGLHLDMRRNTSFNASVPGNIKSFKIYDNGGKDGVYEANSNDTLTLAAPVGYRMILTGNVKTERGYDYLYVYDGANTSAKKLLSITGPATYSSHDKDTSFTAVYSTGEHMTLYFRSDVSNQYEGLDLTVTLERINYTITRKSVTGGTLNSKDADTLGAVVYLTGSPTGSYHLSDVTVVDKDKNVVKSPVYSFDRSKFTMPASNVTVTPTWTDNLTAEGGLHIDLLKNGKIDANIPAGVKSFNLYDNGGKNGSYESNSNDTLTLNAPTGFYLVVTGSISLEAKYDSLYIYDGGNTSATKLFGGYSTVNTITSSGRSLTFRFKSDNSTNYSGLDLKVSVEPITYGIAIADAANGRVSSDKTKAAKDSIVNLSWVYTTGYLIRDIDVRDASDNKVIVNGGWYSGAKANFTMPGSPVIVTPSFTNNLTATGNDGLYINMPKTGTINAEIPAKVKSFKVYDDGGASNTYSNGCNGTLVLNAPEGYLLQLSGSITIENPSTSGTIYDYLDVYDGSDNTAVKLVDKNAGSATISATRSSGRNLTLFFHSDGSVVKDGLDLTVTLVPVDYTVTVATVTGGSMTSDKETAIMDETVTLTATAEKGYLFDGVTVKDADGNSIALSKDIHWYSGVTENTVTFSMPVNAVTVTPKFSAVGGLFVNVPKSGTIDVYIPEEVTSFKVYDDGGKDGMYSDNVNGTLKIVYNNVTNGAALKISGTVASRKDDKLEIGVVEGMFSVSGFYTYAGSGEESIGPYTTSTGLKVSFSSNDKDNAAGLDLTVSTVPAEWQLNSTVAVGALYDDAGFYSSILGFEEAKYKRIGFVNGEYKDDFPVVIKEDFTVDTLLYSREFPTGTFSTMVLPFSVNTENVEGLNAVLRYNGIKTVDGKSSIRMKVVWATDDWVFANKITDSQGKSVHYDYADMKANTPYLVQMGEESFKLKSEAFPLTIKKTAPADTTVDGWTFRGTWEYKMWKEGDPELGYAYGFAASESKENNIDVGDFVKVGKGAWIRPMRAYLVKTEIPPKVQGVRANGNYVTRPSFAQEELPELMSIIIDDEDGDGKQTTVIGHFNTRTGEIKMNNAATKRTFDVKGRNVGDKANKARGAYYGKKILK